MDELFLLPPASVAVPRAYWLDKPYLSSQLVLVQPSTLEMQRVTDAVAHIGPDDFDMELVNDLYGKDCIVIPHRRYDLLTGEFRKDDHRDYLGSSEELWDPDLHYEEAKFLHFSDWPYPKPWIEATSKQLQQGVPQCHTREDGSEDCRNREKWLFVYDDFKHRREVSSKTLSTA